jgi:hypothetical protein
MALLRVKNGKLHLGILVIGMITAKKALAFNSTKMETNMKECGSRTRDMVKVLIGEMKLVN